MRTTYRQGLANSTKLVFALSFIPIIALVFFM
jgi:hypothetical protein